MPDILYFKSAREELLTESGQVVLETHVASYVKGIFADDFCICAGHYHTSKTFIKYIIPCFFIKINFILIYL